MHSSPEAPFQTLKRQDPETDGRLREYIRGINDAGGAYHRLDFGGDLVLRGEYDMTKVLPHYNLPEDLRGQTVLDIGTASGYFALECARRGGKVLAVDLWEEAPFSHLLSFLDADITYAAKDIYTLDREWGEFDLVVCGSLLLHLPDPFGAVRRIRSVCRGQAVVSTACPPDSADTPRPLCEFVGQKATDGDYWAYWTLSAEALRRMMHAAGFSAVTHSDHFLLESEPGEKGFKVPHVVLTGSV